MTDNLTCCFTGHRDIPIEHMKELPCLLDEVLYRQIDRGVRHFIAGGAIGFDTLASLKVLEMRERFGFITLKLCLPCKNQTQNWNLRDISAYNYILKKADSVEYISDVYTKACMLERNRKMVDLSDICIAYCIQNRGGTAFTCAYALKHDTELINLFDLLKKY